MGVVLIVLGIGFFLLPSSINMKLGFASVLIGFFMIVMIGGKQVSKNISDTQLEGSIDAVKKIIVELKLKGNAVVLPKDETLEEERILIPYATSEIIQIPTIAKTDVFLTGAHGELIGIAMPPSGIKLLQDKQINQLLQNTDRESLEEKLQKLIGMDIVKSLSLTQRGSEWRLELEKPAFCPNDSTLCTQYPCPICSALITAIARTANGTSCKLWIKDATHNGRNIIFHLYFINKRKRQKEHADS